MFVDFFIDRPIFASVVAILITLAGAISIPLLPISQFPPIAPPTVQVSATYTGASADVVERTITLPIEEQVNGARGHALHVVDERQRRQLSITVTFELGRDPDIAAVNVNNRVAVAEPRLPEEVRRLGVTVRKQSPELTLVVNLLSPDGSRDALFLSNYAMINVHRLAQARARRRRRQHLRRARYSMRIWLDPERLAKLGLTASDVIARRARAERRRSPPAERPAARARRPAARVPAASRAAGSPPCRSSRRSSSAPSRTARSAPRRRRPRRARRAELQRLHAPDRPAQHPAGRLPAPRRQCARRRRAVRAELVRALASSFPSGVAYRSRYDPTTFVRESIGEVLETLLVAMRLVFLVVFVFLQDWRATLIPAVTIPVSLIGHVRGAVRARLRHQHDHAVRARARDRARRGRRDRGGGERLAPARRRSRARARGGAALDGRGDERDRRGHARARRGVRAGGASCRARPGSSAQFGARGHRGPDLAAQRAHALARALRARDAPEREHKRRFFRAFDRGFAGRRRGYDRGVRALLPRRALVLGVFAALGGVTCCLFRSCPPASSPTRTRATSSPASSFPTARRSTAPSGRRARRTDPDGHAGHPRRPRLGGFDALNQTTPPNFGTVFVTLAPWDGAQAGSSRSTGSSRSAAASSRRSRARGGRLRSPPDPRPLARRAASSSSSRTAAATDRGARRG